MRVPKAPAFPGLRRRMINFENPETAAKWFSVRERIQPSSQHHQLPNSVSNCGRQCLLGKPRAGSDEKTHPSLRRITSSILQDLTCKLPKDTQGQWIEKNRALFQDLVGAPVASCLPGRAAWFIHLHAERLTKLHGGIVWMGLCFDRSYL